MLEFRKSYQENFDLGKIGGKAFRYDPNMTALNFNPMGGPDVGFSRSTARTTNLVGSNTKNGTALSKRREQFNRT